MSTLEDLKNSWNQTQGVFTSGIVYDPATLRNVIGSRVRKHTKSSMQYFWASFTLQMIVYALLSHVIVKYWYDQTIVSLAIAGLLLYLPFTMMLMNKFKKLATTKQSDTGDVNHSIYHYLLRQQTLLRSFYQFKNRYELLLIPLSAALGVTLTFELYVPGGIRNHLAAASLTYVVTLLSCMAAILSENRKNFKEPIQHLQNLIDEFSKQP